MVLKSFSIVLDSPTGAFYTGTTVSGRVLLSIDKPKTVRGVNLKIEGVAKVSFEVSESVKDSDGDTKTRNVHYSSEEEYFSNKFKLLGRGSGDVEIPIGDHVYPFTTVLPPMLPSSFEGEHGSIRYSVKAVIDRPWKFDHEVKVPFIVVAPLDLNYNAQAKEPVKLEKEKTFCCLCCQSGPLQLVMSIPQKGYVAGQFIPITIEVDNASNVEIDNVICKLVKEMKYVASSPSRHVKSSKDEICKLSLEGVGPNGSKSWNPQLSLPQDMPFVNLDPCSIIQSEVILKVSAAVSGLHKNLSIETPLIIGSVPIQQPGGPNFVPGGGGSMQPGMPGFSPAGSSAGFGVGSTEPPPIGLITPSQAAYPPVPSPGTIPPNNSSYPMSGGPYPPNGAQPGVHSYGMTPSPSGPPQYQQGGIQNTAPPYSPSSNQPGVHSYGNGGGNTSYPASTGAPGGSPYPPASGGNPYPPASGVTAYPPASGVAAYPPASGGTPYSPASGVPTSQSYSGAPYPPMSGPPTNISTWSPTAPSAPVLSDEVGYKPPPDNSHHVTEATPLMEQPII